MEHILYRLTSINLNLCTFRFLLGFTFISSCTKFSWNTFDSAGLGILTDFGPSWNCLLANWPGFAVRISKTFHWKKIYWLTIKTYPKSVSDFRRSIFSGLLPGFKHLSSIVQNSSSEHKHSDGGWQVFSSSFSCLQTLLPGIVEQSELHPQDTGKKESNVKIYVDEYIFTFMNDFLHTFILNRNIFCSSALSGAFALFLTGFGTPRFSFSADSFGK